MMGKRKIPNVFNKEELMKLFDIIQEPDLMMMCFIALFCGLRFSEVLKLQKKNFDFYKKEVKILNSKLPNKSFYGYGKDRVVPLPDEIISPLKKWFELIKDKEYLFSSIERDDAPMCKSHLSRRYWSVLKKAGFRIAIGQNAVGKNVYKFNFHTFRHTYATMLWEKTGDIYLVKNALGHSKLETTTIYTHASTKFMREKVDLAFSKFRNPSIVRNVRAPERTIDFGNDSPIDVLRLRVARGEISVEEFQKISGLLTA